LDRQLTIRQTNGKWVTIQRLSVFDRLDFAYHLQSAYQYLSDSPDTAITEMYVTNDGFRYHCDTCLQLANLDAKYLSDTQFTGLLFASAEYPYGLLNQFNFPLDQSTKNAKSPTDPETKGSLLGKLWRSLGDLQLAIRIATELPTDVLEDALYEMKPAEDKNKDKARKYLERLNKSQ